MSFKKRKRSCWTEYEAAAAGARALEFKRDRSVSAV